MRWPVSRRWWLLFDQADFADVRITKPDLRRSLGPNLDGTGACDRAEGAAYRRRRRGTPFALTRESS